MQEQWEMCKPILRSKMLHKTLYTSQHFLNIQTLHLCLQKDTRRKKVFYASSGTGMLCVSEEPLLHATMQLYCKQGHLHTRRQGGGSHLSEVSLLRHWPWSSKALTHLLCF